jgi:hypothetical protein
LWWKEGILQGIVEACARPGGVMVKIADTHSKVPGSNPEQVAFFFPHENFPTIVRLGTASPGNPRTSWSGLI